MKKQILLIIIIFTIKANIIGGPVISSFTPQYGVIGSTVTITGTGFNPISDKNIVFFGATKAVVTSASTTALTVTVPVGASNQLITITDISTGLIAYSTKPFVPTFTCGGTIDSTSFADKVDFATGYDPYNIATTDLDGDGKPDIVEANISTNTISVLQNTTKNDTVSFNSKIDIITGSSPRCIAVVDLNGDGKADLAVINQTSRTVSILQNTSSPGTISFLSLATFSTSYEPLGIIAGDINNDGKPDIIVSTAYSKPLSIYLNQSYSGTISFAPKTTLSLAGSYPYKLNIGDLDNDGKLDIVTANNSQGTISIIRNTSTSGSVTFDAAINITTKKDINDITIGDIDGDGKQDILATFSSLGSGILVLKNNSSSGNISFAINSYIDISTHYQGIKLGDLDGDGKIDIAAVKPSYKFVSVFKNTSTSGNVSFASQLNYTIGKDGKDIVIEDFNGDNKPDMAILNSGNDNVSIILNKVNIFKPIISPSKATICKGTSIPISVKGNNYTYLWSNGETKDTLLVSPSISTVYSVTGFDVNGCTNTASLNLNVLDYPDFTFNGNKSICIGKSTTITVTGINSYSWNTGATTAMITVSPTTSTTYSVTGTNGCKIGTASVTVTVNPLPTLSTSVNPQEINYGENANISVDGANIFKWSTNESSSSITVSPLSSTIYSVTGTDINGCQSVNLAGLVVHSPQISSFSPLSGYVGSSVTITGNYFNPTAENNIVYFGATRAKVTQASTSNLTVIVPSGASNKPITVTDSTRGVTAYSQQSFAPLFCGGNIDSSSFNSNNFNVGDSFEEPVDVKIKDLNNDGKADVIFAISDLSYYIQVFPNNSTPGNLILSNTTYSYKTQMSPMSVAVDDLDGDGKPDLVSVSYNNQVSVLQNKGTNTDFSFAESVQYYTTLDPYDVELGDLNNDGKPDVVVANRDSNTISIFINTSTPGNITFAPRFSLKTGNNPISIAIRDIDGDALADIAVVNSGNGSISIFRNTSKTPFTSFAPRLDAVVYGGPYAMELFDMNGDGKNDMVVSNNGSDKISVFKNLSTLGNIKFDSQVSFPATSEPEGLAVGDLNGDGKPDVVVANHYGAVVSVFTNESTEDSIKMSNKVDYTTSSWPTSVAINDLDGDGKPEIVAVNYYYSSATILQNKVNPSAQIITPATTTICAQSKTVLTAGNASSYLWSNGENSASINVMPDKKTTYTVTSTDDKGCIKIASATVSVNPLPSPAATIEGDSVISLGLEPIEYSVPPIANSDSYVWSIPNIATGSSITNSIALKYNTVAIDTLKVQGINTCGLGVASIFPIRIIPTTPIISYKGKTLHSTSLIGNQWYDENGAIIGATSQDYTPKQNGTYYLIVTTNNLTSEKSNSITISDISTGIITLNNCEIRTYPTIVNDKLLIRSTNSCNISKVQIISELGIELFVQTNENKALLEVPMIDYPAGIYYVQLFIDGNIYSNKIIKK